MIKYGIDQQAVEHLMRLRLVESRDHAQKLVAGDLPRALVMIKEAMDKSSENPEEVRDAG